MSYEKDPFARPMVEFGQGTPMVALVCVGAISWAAAAFYWTLTRLPGNLRASGLPAAAVAAIVVLVLLAVCVVVGLVARVLISHRAQLVAGQSPRQRRLAKTAVYLLTWAAFITWIIAVASGLGWAWPVLGIAVGLLVLSAAGTRAAAVAIVAAVILALGASSLSTRDNVVAAAILGVALLLRLRTLRLDWHAAAGG